jgi:CRISPR system Cascade subunit CasB
MTRADSTHPLVAHVASLDRAALATLRHSLSFAPGTWPHAFPIVEPFVASAPPARRAIAYLVAGLMAWSRGTEPGDGDMGAACARLRSASDSGSIERRFLDLLDADRDALPHRLRQMVALMASKSITPAWSELIRDLAAWDHPDRYVQQRWARSFYRSDAEADDDETSPSAATTTDAPAAPDTDA